MPIRRMRMRRRRRSTVRIRRRRTYRRRRIIRRTKAPEVKYFTRSAQDFAEKIYYTALGASTLDGAQHQISGILGGIAQGIQRDQRIGGKIFVKSISFHIYTRPCPSGTDANLGSYLYRVMITNTGSDRIVAGTAIADYFGSAEQRTINGFIDRSRITTYYDRTYVVRADMPMTPTIGNALTAPGRIIKFSVPMNQVVNYQENSIAPKDDRHHISLCSIIATSAMSAVTNARQIACTDISLRVYYTDV